jgi:hypothetical protein
MSNHAIFSFERTDPNSNEVVDGLFELNDIDFEIGDKGGDIVE